MKQNHHITIGVLKMQGMTWKDNGPQLMKYYTNKLKKTKFPDHLVIDGKQITDQKAISNAFNIYFVNVGPNLAAKIKLPNSKSFNNCLRNPTSNKFNLACTKEEKHPKKYR